MMFARIARNLAKSIATMAIIGVVMAVLVGGGLVMRIVRAWQK